MRDLVTAGDGDRKLDALASRERAVSRVSMGVFTLYLGTGSLIAVVLAEGIGSTAQLIGQFGATLLFSTGCILIASATPHLARFGGRVGALSLASFAAAGLSGLVAAAEMFTTYVLGSNVLQSWDEPATWAAGAFAMTGLGLLKLAQRKQRDLASQPEA
jgi:hypothetical protein